jgi:methionyl-tRNA synthetase
VAEETLRTYRGAMDRYALHEGTAAVFRLIDATNEFIAEAEPWALAKDASKADRLSQVLYDTAEALRVSAVLLTPVIPTSTVEILRRAGEPTAAKDLRLDRDAVWKADLSRTTVRGPALWPRLETSEPVTAGVTSQKTETSIVSNPADPNQAPGAGAPAAAAAASAPGAPAAAPAASTPTGDQAAAAAAPAPAAPSASPIAGERLSIEEFMKIDLRVAKVLTAERVPKSKKLVKLTVDVGFEQRTLVAGIAEAYEPEALIGRTVVIVANLKPATLMGVESNGMVLAGSPEGGKPTLVGFDNPPPLGSRVR